MFNTQPMKGSTGSNFTLVAVTTTARLGYRDLGLNQFRVRVEPQEGAKFSFPSGWRSPETSTPGANTNRYSIVVLGTKNRDVALLDAFRIINGVAVAQVTTVPEGTQFGKAAVIPEYQKGPAF